MPLSNGQKIPEWREEPEPVIIRCHFMPAEHEGKVIAIFSVKDRNYALSIEKRLADTNAKGFRAMIIADVEGAYLVDLPSQTMSQGSRMLISKQDMSKLLVEASV